MAHSVMLALAALLVAQNQAMQSAGSSCTEDQEITSLVQVNKALLTSSERQNTSLPDAPAKAPGSMATPTAANRASATKPMLSGAPAKAPTTKTMPSPPSPMAPEARAKTVVKEMREAMNIAPTAVANQPILQRTMPRSGYSASEAADVARADPAAAKALHQAVDEKVMEDKAVADVMKYENAEHIRDMDVLPPPLGHGHVMDNPDVVDAEAVIATMPGSEAPAGSVVQAFDAARAKAEDPRDTPNHQWARDYAHFNRAMDEQARIEDRLTGDKALTTGRIRVVEKEMEDSIRKKEAAEKAAIHTVEQARKAHEEAAIRRNQAQVAAWAGDRYGQALGYERGHRELDEKVLARIEAAEAAVDLAKQRQVAEGVTATDDIQAQKESEDRAMADSYRKEKLAERVKMEEDAHLFRDALDGAQGVKEHIISRAAEATAAAWDHDTRKVQEEMEHAKAGDVEQVRRDLRTQERRGHVWDGPHLAGPNRDVGDPSIIVGAIDNSLD